MSNLGLVGCLDDHSTLVDLNKLVNEELNQVVSLSTSFDPSELLHLLIELNLLHLPLLILLENLRLLEDPNSVSLASVESVDLLNLVSYANPVLPNVDLSVEALAFEWSYHVLSSLGADLVVLQVIGLLGALETGQRLQSTEHLVDLVVVHQVEAVLAQPILEPTPAPVARNSLLSLYLVLE